MPIVYEANKINDENGNKIEYMINFIDVQSNNSAKVYLHEEKQAHGFKKMVNFIISGSLLEGGENKVKLIVGDISHDKDGYFLSLQGEDLLKPFEILQKTALDEKTFKELTQRINEFINNKKTIKTEEKEQSTQEPATQRFSQQKSIIGNLLSFLDIKTSTGSATKQNEQSGNKPKK